MFAEVVCQSRYWIRSSRSMARSRRAHLSNDHAGVKAVAEAFGYSAEELTSIPAGANMGLSCGNPTATAHLRAGEVVVDLGSGGGLDVFLASKMVGPTGRAIGIDMTPAMIERARDERAARRLHQCGVLPVHHRPDSAAGLLLSIASSRTASLNLAPDKPAVFREIARVLKPGGRVAVSDIALKHELPEAVAQEHGGLCRLHRGAILIDDYRAGLLAAGFRARRDRG